MMDTKIVRAYVELTVIVQSDDELFDKAEARDAADIYVKQAFPVLKWQYVDTGFVNYDEYGVHYSRHQEGE